MKHCPRCGQTKSFSFFFADRSKSRGVGTYCKSCDKARSSEWASKNRLRSAAIKRAYVARHPDQRRQSVVAWGYKNLERVRLKGRAWQKAHRAQATANTADYRAKKLEATPPWLMAAYTAESDGFYVFCQLFHGFHVDHVVPLRGKTVRGLHVPWNLQVIPKADNFRKSNRLYPLEERIQGEEV